MSERSRDRDAIRRYEYELERGFTFDQLEALGAEEAAYQYLEGAGGSLQKLHVMLKLVFPDTYANKQERDRVSDMALYRYGSQRRKS